MVLIRECGIVTIDMWLITSVQSLAVVPLPIKSHKIAIAVKPEMAKH